MLLTSISISSPGYVQEMCHHKWTQPHARVETGPTWILLLLHSVKTHSAERAAWLRPCTPVAQPPSYAPTYSPHTYSPTRLDHRPRLRVKKRERRLHDAEWNSTNELLLSVTSQRNFGGQLIIFQSTETGYCHAGILCMCVLTAGPIDWTWLTRAATRWPTRWPFDDHSITYL